MQLSAVMQLHSAVPSSSAYNPSGHRMQSIFAVAAVTFWYVFTGHKSQSCTPRPFSPSRYVPFGHCVIRSFIHRSSWQRARAKITEIERVSTMGWNFGRSHRGLICNRRMNVGIMVHRSLLSIGYVFSPSKRMQGAVAVHYD